ncbi:hypothetical protein BTN49_1631 [Candidatus Enterovibrio escicola]|uniref:Uncharacterized protein n=1 Tax=Candidatus Enterovibrio escicola TaxID=1927127 RepID=A0A2A5T3D8_9GAMM|nr:hypothetical protein BTN49_1631 [Candidatus Enterovibrio escacola]
MALSVSLKKYRTSDLNSGSSVGNKMISAGSRRLVSLD